MGDRVDSMLPDNFRIKALSLFPDLRRMILDDTATPHAVLQTVARGERKATDYERRGLFAFTEWCLRWHEAEIQAAALSAFYAPLFDERYSDWSVVVVWLSPFVVARSWSSWEARLSADEMARLQSAFENRAVVRYEPLTIATQTNEGTYPRQSPLVDITVRLTMQLEVLSPFGVGIGVQYPWATMPEDWRFELSEYLIEGALAGLSSVELPNSDQGMQFAVTGLSVDPPITETTAAADVRQLGEVLYGMTFGLAAALWRGLLAFEMHPRDQSYIKFSERYWYRAVRKGMQARGE